MAEDRTAGWCGHEGKMIERTLLFTDVVDSTRLVERLGDARAAHVWSAHDQRARTLLARHSGREIDRTDGFFLLFERSDRRRPLRDRVSRRAARTRARGAGRHSRRSGHSARERAGRRRARRQAARGGRSGQAAGRARDEPRRGGQTLLTAAARAALGELPEGAASSATVTIA